MKKFISFLKVLAFLWMALIVMAIMVLLYPVVVILPESLYDKIRDKFAVFYTWFVDYGIDLVKEQVEG